MSSARSSMIHSRARRSPIVTSSNPSSNTLTTHGGHSAGDLTSKLQKRRIRRGLVICGLAFLIVELLLVRASLVYYKDEGSGPEQMDMPASPPPHWHTGPPDGSFHGYPVYYRNVLEISKYTKPYTLLNCVGENYQPKSWQHRSCHFKLLCFNLTSRNYQAYERREDRDMRAWEALTPLMDRSESYLWNSTVGVSIGGINVKWGEEGISRLQWFPQILAQPPTEFYALPPNVVMIPYHSMAGWNPGSTVWDDLLPMFTLTEMFQLPTNEYELLAIRQMLDGDINLEDSCDAKREECERVQAKFWPLLNHRTRPTTQRDIKLRMNDGTWKSDLVCAKNAVAGIGDLTDHGIEKLHGQRKEDYETTHNHGRGELFWKFRNFCLENLGFATDSSALRRPPYRVVISVQSSTSPTRNFDFGEQQAHLESSLDDASVTVETAVLKDMSLREQVQLASETSVFISSCGGGTATATFLPKGATAIIYCNEISGQGSTIGMVFPARLDWDLFNHLSYLRVHWFPSSTMNERHDLNILSLVVRGALNRQNWDSSLK